MLIPPRSVFLAFWLSLVPLHSLQTFVVRNLFILFSPFSVFAFFNASSMALCAFLYSAFSSNSFPFFDGMLMYFLTGGPLYIMFFSFSVRFLNGVFSLTPSSPATWYIQEIPNWFHASTAPSSSVLFSSDINLVSSTSLINPVPLHFGHAPSELNAYSSAPSPWNSTPHSGHWMGISRAMFSVGFCRCPFGQVWLPHLEYSSLREVRSSVDVANVDLIFGVFGRWWSASAAGTYCADSTCAF